MTGEAPVRSVARAVSLLLILARGPRSLGDVAKLAQLPKSTAYRLLASLSHGGLVMQDPSTGYYHLGLNCLVIADAIMRGVGGLGVTVRPILARLRETTGETITIHIRVGTQRVCVEELMSRQPVRYTAGVPATAPIHIGSAGKLLLAYQGEEELRELLNRITLGSVSTEATIRDRAGLEEELAGIRQRGYSQSRGERVVGATAVSAPIFAKTGEILAALSILGPSERLSDSRLRELLPRLLEVAREITERLATIESPINGDRKEDEETAP